MDFVRIGTTFMKTVNNGNSTANATLNQLPASLVEAVIPGYGVISQFVKDHFGFDISIVVTVLAGVLGLYKALTWAWGHLYSSFEIYCMSKVYIEEEDDLFEMVIKWLAAQKLTKRTRRVKAVTQYGSAWDDDEDGEDGSALTIPAAGGHFNFGKWQAQIPPRFEPYYGLHRFWHNGHFFSFQRTQKPNPSMSRWGAESEDLLEIRCIGFSTQPIKNFLQHLKTWSSEQKESRTVIRNASTKHWRGMGWGTSQSRPSRPIDTVILDDCQKEMIVNDMEEFLHPDSPKWYASRGIPYRRGYLFHGPPGTGKTSLSFSLAGIFGLDIYCCALNDPELTEGDLRELFNSLPRRCIVLLEDIDEAGIKRPDDKNEAAKPALPAGTTPAHITTATDKRRDSAIDDDLSLSRTTTASSTATDSSLSTTSSSTSAPSTSDPTTPTSSTAPIQTPASAPTELLTAQTLAEALLAAAKAATQPTSAPAHRSGRGRKPRRRNVDAPAAGNSSSEDNGISLSGLLNAIDGVATHEGRVLIMTTNHPENLDEALVRTGRVDVRVGFDYASKEQVRVLFGRMYGGDCIDQKEEQGQGRKGKGKGKEGRSWWEGLDIVEVEGKDQATPVTPKSPLFAKAKDTGVDSGVMKGKLEDAARGFADKVPDKVFSPSDIQGFLLLHKKTPLRALKEVEGWVEKELEKKREKMEGV